MSDFATTIHNIPPASVARRLRSRAQWAAYQALAAAACEWVTRDALGADVYREPHYTWDQPSALKGVIARLRSKDIPVQTNVEIRADGTVVRYRLPLEWQREQDGEVEP